ncbi:hypothetical protein WJX73_002283 [Symbiochloris irregularis]|uniref:Two-component response regulator n=1 Tax=Symbiochloris irregularis TaxID=706552 RepID=A0AAW1NY82_9CHLO
MLKHCNYLVTTCTNGKDALAKLRDPRAGFDLVLSDVYMPDMDGFKLLEHVGLELDLPVIMMSSNGETSVVLRGVTHGAVDFLIKPVRIEELRNVWQHVVRRKRSTESQRDSLSGSEGSDDTKRSERKRKEQRRDSDETGSAKKQRVVWNQEMHQQFVEAVQALGVEKAVPKKILDLMPNCSLTRENVASHLQKYRAALRRGLQDSTSAQQGPGSALLAPRTSNSFEVPGGFMPMGPPPRPASSALDLATPAQNLNLPGAPTQNPSILPQGLAPFLMPPPTGTVLPQPPSGVPTGAPRLPTGGFLPSPPGPHQNVPMLPANFMPGQLPGVPAGMSHTPGGMSHAPAHIPANVVIPSMASGMAHQSLGLAPVPGLSALHHRGITPPTAMARQPSNLAVEPSCMTTRPASTTALNALEPSAQDRILGGNADGAIPQHPLLPDPPGGLPGFEGATELPLAPPSDIDALMSPHDPTDLPNLGPMSEGLPDHIFRDHLMQHPSPANSQELGESKVNLNDDMWKLLLE